MTTLDTQADIFARELHDAERADLPPDEAFARASALATGLFPHQVEGVAFLLGRRRAILADDMGLGKTRQAIVALRHTAPGGPYLVVCPASVKRNWAREIAIVDPEARVRIVEGKTPDVAPQGVTPNGHASWTILNYDVLGAHTPVLEAIDWAGFVIDEAHYLKNHTSGRSRHTRALVERVAARIGSPGPAVFALTGTPLTNRPRDLFVLLQLAGHPIGRSFLSFAKRYCDAAKNQYGWVTDGASNIEELTVQLHGVMLRRSKDQVLSLPPKLRTWLPIDVPPDTASADTRKVVRLLIENQRAKAAGGDGPRRGGVIDPERRTRVQLLALLSRARRTLAVAKASATLAFVEGIVDQGEKVIVFSCFDEPVQRIAARFGERAVVLTGATPTATRQAIVDRFQQDEGVRVFVANLIAGGIGVNLTAASQVVFNDLDWVPANHWQGEDRAYRIGQTRNVNATYMVAADTIDSFVQVVLEAKAALVGAVVDGEALSEGAGGGVLDELEHVLGRVSPRLADLSREEVDAELIDQLLREAADTYRAEHGVVPVGAPAQSVVDPDVMRRALLALARTLAEPAASRYRIASHSRPGKFYEVTVHEGDVTCTCPGFEYRGMCRHAREVQACVAAGRSVPDAYEAIR
jgi:SWI/SNF-related matrix-associated actin-dependent regulator 1 of chromatin subfamily A